MVTLSVDGKSCKDTSTLAVYDLIKLFVFVGTERLNESDSVFKLRNSPPSNS